jgi:hypothetical protein
LRVTTALVRREVYFIAISGSDFRERRGFQDPPAGGPRVRILFPPAANLTYFFSDITALIRSYGVIPRMGKR